MIIIIISQELRSWTLRSQDNGTILHASLPQPLYRALPATIGNMCYLLGGFTEGGASKKVFSVCLDDLISKAFSQPMASASAPTTPSPQQSLYLIHH